MSRWEWGLVLVLTCITIATLAFVPPPRLPRGEEQLAALLGTPSATPSPTATFTPRPTPTPSPTSSPTRRRPTLTPTATAKPSPTPSATPFPFDTHPELPRYIYVDQASQRMYLFEHGRLLRIILCSTGLPDPDKYTPAWSGRVGRYWGTFHAFGVYADEAWYLFKSEGSILIHSLPYTLYNGYKVYQDREALGVRPASHGCIRISPEDAAWFTAWKPEGVPITVSEPYLEKWRAYFARNLTPTPTVIREEVQR
ncbi:MAG: L,D-transpeptidase [Anaerolineae bacterium]|nr:L,D-transpeptidase [Anaerolineae bacterium]